MKFTIRLALVGFVALLAAGPTRAGTITGTSLEATASVTDKSGTSSLTNNDSPAFASVSNGGGFENEEIFEFGNGHARAFVNSHGVAASVSQAGFGGVLAATESDGGDFAPAAITGPSPTGGPVSASSMTTYEIEFENQGPASALAYSFTINNPRLEVGSMNFDASDPFIASLGVRIVLDDITTLYDFTATLTSPTTPASPGYDFSVTSDSGSFLPTFIEQDFSDSVRVSVDGFDFSHSVELGTFATGQTGTIKHIIHTSIYAPGTGYGDFVEAGIGDPPFLSGGPIFGAPSSLGPSTVPEPASMLAFGMIGVAGLLRRRRR